MSAARGILGGVFGAAVATVGLRVHSIARSRKRSIGSVVLDLPAILTDDAARIADAARRAVDDGRVAAHRAGIEFDEQVAAHARRTQGNDV